MRTTPGLSFLKSAIAEAVKVEAARTEERQAEAQRRQLPFPHAVDPDSLVADGCLVDISILARRAIDSAGALRGFRLPVYATPAVGEAMQRLGLESVVAAGWWCAHRENMEDGLPRTGGTTRVVSFLVSGPEGAEAWFSYQAAQRPSGALYGVIFIRSEENPAAPSSTTDRKEATNARA